MMACRPSDDDIDELRRRAADCERLARRASSVAAAVEMMRMARQFLDQAGRIEADDGHRARERGDRRPDGQSGRVAPP